MNRTDVTYGQLDKVLRSLGFSCRVVQGDPPVRLYEHKATGAISCHTFGILGTRLDVDGTSIVIAMTCVAGVSCQPFPTWHETPPPLPALDLRLTSHPGRTCR
jgi:hypothetical protein